jgi:hypothetical protein
MFSYVSGLRHGMACMACKKLPMGAQKCHGWIKIVLVKMMISSGKLTKLWKITIFNG